MLNSLNLKGGKDIKKQPFLVGLSFVFKLSRYFLMCNFEIFFFLKQGLNHSWNLRVTLVWSPFESSRRKRITCLRGGQSEYFYLTLVGECNFSVP